MEQTDIFSLVGDISSDTAPNDVEHALTNMSDLVVQTVHRLLFRRAITNEHYTSMMYYNQSRRFRVNKLDFIPKIHDVSIFLVSLLFVVNHIYPLE
jgi:hypothetical protein